MKISVITTLYYGKKYLNALLSVIAKNVVCLSGQAQVEYILVNDSPAENITQEELDQIMSQLDQATRKLVEDKQFSARIVVNEKNRGIHFSRVHGLQESAGEYILFLDQDDLITENALSSLLQQIKSNPDADVCVANGYRQYEDKGIPLYQSEKIMSMLSNEKYYLYGTDLIFSPGQCMIKRSAISKEWLTNHLTINGCDDFMLWLLMLNHGCKFIGTTDKLYYHMETESNYSGSFDAMQNSYFHMCSLLEQIESYPSDKVRVLKRRGQLKSVMKQKGRLLYKMVQILRNLDVIYYIISYKRNGYH